MPEYTLDEMRTQAVKAARYFGTGMKGFGRDFIAVRFEDTVTVVATGEAGVKLDAFVNDGGIGRVEAGVEDVTRLAAPAVPATSAPAEASGEGNGSAAGAAGQLQANSKEVQNLEVVLVPMYHVPPSEGPGANKPGNIHLHVLNDAKLGRRVRLSGECLCSKKHGSRERMPQEGERKMCDECVKVAADAGIVWSLA